MTKEQQYFIQIIRDFIFGKNTEYQSGIDWIILCDFFQKHQLTAIAYAQCKMLFPVTVNEKYRATFLGTVSTNVRRRKSTETILAELNDQAIKCFTVKGFDIADYYPNWQYRTMGDTDIVVDDLEKAHSILIDNGFQSISKIKDREYQYSKQNMEFELHDRLVYDEAINIDGTTKFLNDFKHYLAGGKLDDSFHFIFVLNHLRKHFMNSGVGFRQFVDIAVMVKNDDKIDWRWTEDTLQEIGLLPFARTVFFYIDRWFGVVAPIASVEVPENVFESSTAYIFDNGVFGFDNKDNTDFLASNAVRQAKYPQLAMIVVAVKKVFPSYKSLTASKHYAFLKARPYLLPVAWIYRLFRGVTNNRIDEGKKMIQKSFVPIDYITKREEMFRNWGLK